MSEFRDEGTGRKANRNGEDVGAARPRKDPGYLARFKEFVITSFAVEHRTSSVVLLILITIMGLTSYRVIPKESFPEIEIPMIVVNTLYPGVSPSDIETLVTRPLEEELSAISEIKELSSQSVEGYSSITAEFETTANLDEALQQVREKVDLARPELPQEAEEPGIFEISFSEFPIMQVNLAGDFDLVYLKELAEDLQDELESVPQILRVDVRGGLEREVKVDVHLSRLQFYNLALQDVIDAIAAENVNIPGGSIDVGDQRFLVRVDGEFDDPELIEDLVITADDAGPIYVRDLADVEFGFAERETYARLDGSPVVTLDIVKRSGENIIQTADQVRAVIEEMRPLFPATMTVKITGDMSRDIFSMVSSLENNIISGLILIVSVLLFFLGLRTSLFVAISIPSSMLLSFVVLRFLGVSMNMVVLFSLILALGMLVDNAIVVVENIYRYVERGWDRRLAAKKATGEVAGPVIAATLTTLAAFAPLLFWPGISGEFMSYLPTTLIVTLSSSLFVALVIVPTLCSMFILREGEEPPPLTRAARFTLIVGSFAFILIFALANPLTAALLLVTAGVLWGLYRFVLKRAATAFQHWWLERAIHFYETQLVRALDHPVRVLAASGALLLVTVILFGRFNAGVEFFPESIPPRQIMIDIEAPTGTRADFTDRLVRRIEAKLPDYEGVALDGESVVATVGAGGGGGGGEGGPTGPESGQVAISFVEFQNQQIDGFATLAVLQETIADDLAGADISVDKSEEGPATGLPVNIELVGSDPDILSNLADEMLATLRADPVYAKLVRLDSNLDDARPELGVSVDREKAALYGLSTRRVGQAIRGAIQGIEAAKYRTGNDEYDIIVRLAEEDRDELSTLSELTVLSEGDPIPLLSVASWEVGEGAGSIRRLDMDRAVTVSSEVRAGFNSNAVLGEVQLALAEFAESLPPGTRFATPARTRSRPRRRPSS